ncbi:MAG: DUF3047 domain-containing protein [Pseudomonadales bacterium]|nr:DUF3047 domain-containing protein [Pseudomonadales bacterium]MCP5189656.1 DUF3047 domain-containing protein [Pseudomonadales bacterium]
MTGLLAELGVAGRLAARAMGRRVRAQLEPFPDLEAFTREMEDMLAQAPATVVQDYHWVDLPASRPPWVDTGVRLEVGDQVSYFAAGRVYASRLLDIYVSPALQLWCKVGEAGEVFRGTRDSHSFTADRAGALLFGNYFPNDWVDHQGARRQDDAVYGQVSGGLKVLVIRWADGALAGLQALSTPGGPQSRLQAEIARLQKGDSAPSGWHYLWHLGPAEIYSHRQTPHGSPCIHCHTRGDVGILQKEVDLPLDESSEISWRWCVARLPSTLREDTLPSHDYLSLAVEFDNGRDITYYWSSNLAVGTGYDCPLPNWQGREFHVVVRSGPQGLGQWHQERRNLYADYLDYMGEPPARIVRVWLIANSIFQRGEGQCDYADIVMHHQGVSTQVL